MVHDARREVSAGKIAGSPAELALGMGALFIFALALRLHGIAAKPFWMDEVTTIKRASLPLGAMLRDALVFHQLPGYFVVTSWVLPFGSDEFWVRLPAAVFGALSCALGFGIARRLGGLQAGLAAGLLMALSPAMVQYGQEARSYTAVISAILLGLWGLVALAQAGGETRWPAWVAYVLGTVAALNILSVALFWLLAANLAAVCLGGRKDRKFRWHWLLAQLLILTLCLPWFIAIRLWGEHGTLGGLDWVPPLDGARLWWAFSGTYLLYVTSLIKVRVFAPGVPGLGMAVAALAVAGLVGVRTQRCVLAVLAIAVLCLPVALLLVSLVTPILMPRYLLWSAAPYFICAGLGFSVLPRSLQWPALACLLLLLAVNLAPYYRDETKPRWDLAGAELEAGLRPGDLLLVDDPQAVSMMNLYLQRRNASLPDRLWTTDVARAVAWRDSGKRVWAVQGVVGQVDHEDRAQFLRRIAALGTPQFSEPAGMDIVLLRFSGAAK